MRVSENLMHIEMQKGGVDVRHSRKAGMKMTGDIIKIFGGICVVMQKKAAALEEAAAQKAHTMCCHPYYQPIVTQFE